MQDRRKYSFRIRYQKDASTEGIYFVRESDVFSGEIQFHLHCGKPRSAIISIDTKIGNEWVKVQHGR